MDTHNIHVEVKVLSVKRVEVFSGPSGEKLASWTPPPPLSPTPRQIIDANKKALKASAASFIFFIECAVIFGWIFWKL